MNLLDTNGISHILENNLALREEYYLAPDVSEEVELTQLVHGRRLPAVIHEISELNEFNGAVYLRHYNLMLNKYEGRSFYNMTGFGDVSILATIHAIVEDFDRQANEQLFHNSEQIVVYTGDRGLTTKINAEFLGRDIVVSPVNVIS